MNLRRLLPLLLVLCLPVSPAFAADDEEELDDEGLSDEEENEGVDDETIYREYREERRGESPDEEIEAWQRYLETYTKSLYALEIRKRIEALQEASYAEVRDDRRKDSQHAEDAKEREIPLHEPALLAISPNTRRKIEIGFLWGYPTNLQYDVGVEWAFFRQFSAFLNIRHETKGFGAGIQIGAKYALIKDLRTNVVLTPFFDVEFGGSQREGGKFAIEPGLAFGWIPTKILQLQTSALFHLRLDSLHTWVVWDIALVILPKDVFGIYVESKQKHSLWKADDGVNHYLGFHQAGIGVKIMPSETVELTLGANVPYSQRTWVDYRYFGIHFDLVFYLGKPKG